MSAPKTVRSEIFNRNYSVSEEIWEDILHISELQAIRVSVPLRKPATIATRTVKHRDYTVLKLTTNDGIIGVSCVWWHHPALIIERYLKEHIIGEDPFRPQKIWNKIYREVYRERRGGAICAISAVDIAVWDIIGQAAKTPLYKLLGGSRDKVPCYASGGYYKEGKGVKDLVKEMVDYVEKGFKAVKMKVGAVSLEEDVERVKAVRKAVGSGIDIMVDANNAYTPYQAIKACKIFDKYDIYWFEEPVWPDDIKGSALVAASLDTPIASGEIEYTKFAFKDLIENRAVDIVQADATMCGGITEWLKIAKMAECWGIPVAPHAFHDLHTHLVAAVSNGLTVEYFHREVDVMKDMELYEKTLQPKKGMLEPPNIPGHGIEISETALKKYRAK